MKGKATVNAGVCGFKAEIVTESLEEMGMVRVKLDTDCPNLQKLDKSFEVNAMEIIKDGCNIEVFKKFAQVSPPMCCPCPVLLAVYSTAKIASGMALAKDVEITLKRED